MYEFDWSSIVPSLPYLLDGLVITLKITVIAIVVGIVWGTLLAVMRLSTFKPLAWFANRLRERVPLHPAGDGAAVVLPDRARLPAKRAGAVAENRYPSDLGDGGVLDV